MFQQQTARTVQMTPKCGESDKPRVIYSETKLNDSEKKRLSLIIQLYQYSCGSILQELKTIDNRTPRVN